MSRNLETVAAIYEAFRRRDIPAILEHVAEDVRWEEWADNSAQHAGVPWLLPRHGKEGVREFFHLVSGFQVRHFRVLSLMEGTNQVAAEVVLESDAPGTGGHFRDEELHLWTFGEEGKVVRMRHYADTAKQIAAALDSR